MTTSPKVGTPARRRPKDRKEQIARVSAEAFSELGYHGVSMEEIASRVGVTAASLYRHHARKYEMFRAAVLGLGHELVDCTAFVDDEEHPDPAELWDRVVNRLIDTTLRRRSSGGLYRWEGRYLELPDQLELNEQIKLVNRRLQLPLSRLRPGLPSRQRWTLSSAVLSVIGSITDHRAQLPEADIRHALVRMAASIRDTELPVEGDGTELPRGSEVGAAAGEYEQLLHVSLQLFNERGYRDTGMDDIAAAVGIPTSTIYRYFSGKQAILTTTYRRAADRVSSDVSTILANVDDATDATDAIVQLVDAYVRRSFADPELAYVYYVERNNVPEEDRAALHNIQRATIGAWVRQVVAARPDMSSGEALFAVHAAFSLVVDIGRLMDYERTQASHAVVCHLLRTTLLGNRG